VLQFFLIVLGFAPLAIMAVKKAGNWEGLSKNVAPVMVHSWTYMGKASENPMGVDMFA